MKTRKWSSTIITLVLLMFEQLTYLEVLGAEYMAFDLHETWEMVPESKNESEDKSDESKDESEDESEDGNDDDEEKGLLRKLM